MITQPKTQIKSKFVIIRGFGGRPAKLRLSGFREGVVDVVGTNPDQPMPFRQCDAFQFNGKLLSDLLEAFESDRERLNSLWEQAIQLECPDTEAEAENAIP